MGKHSLEEDYNLVKAASGVVEMSHFSEACDMEN